MRGNAGPGPILAILLAALAVGSAAGGCATVEYRVPSSEMQRLVQLPPEARGSEIRVVPASTPAGPPLTAADVAPRLPAAVPPAPPPAPADEMPPPPDEVPLCLDVDVAPPPVVVDVPRVVVVPPPAPIARPRAFREPVVVARAPVAPPPIVHPPVFHPAVAHPVVARPVVRAPAIHYGGGGGHHGGGGKINGAVAVAALVVLPIIVIAVIANAAAQANARAAEAASFDGWVSVTPDHLLRLHYAGKLERMVPLTTLTPSDLVGVQFGVLRDQDGPVTRGIGASR